MMENNIQKIEWDKYWGKEKKRKIYDVIASFYREKIIRKTLNYFIKTYLIIFTVFGDFLNQKWDAKQ